MYETFIFHNDHSALHWLLTLDKPSGRLMRWLLCIAEFDFQLKYKRRSANQQADSLSRLATNAETIYYDDDDAIPALLLPNTIENNSEQKEFLNIAYNPLDKVYATHEVPNTTNHVFTLIEPKEHVSAQLHD